MEEEIEIINNQTRNERIKNFLITNKKQLIIIIGFCLLLLFGYFIYEDIKKKNKIKLANKYNLVTINYISENKSKVEKELIEIINAKDKAYSPLALYFLIDNNIIDDNQKINGLFDILINEIKLEKEIKNLIIYKKALFNSNFETENNLIKILKPIINSKSIWKADALYLLGEFFYFKNEKQKAKEFFYQILELENVSKDIKLETQKRIQRDFSE